MTADLAPIIIPDLHGSLDALEVLLAENPGRRLVFLGDLLDRGPQQVELLFRVQELYAEGRVEAICLGNHEAMAIQGMLHGATEDLHCWLGNGGHNVIAQFGDNVWLLLRTLRWLESVAVQWHDVQTPHGVLRCVHGDLPPPHVTPAARLRGSSLYETHLWHFRGSSDEPCPHGVRASVHGHVALKQPTYDQPRRAYYLDTGAYATGELGYLDAETLGLGLARVTHPEGVET